MNSLGSFQGSAKSILQIKTRSYICRSYAFIVMREDRLLGRSLSFIVPVWASEIPSYDGSTHLHVSDNGCSPVKPFEPQREKTYLQTCALNKDSNQPACPHSLTRVFQTLNSWHSMLLPMKILFILPGGYVRRYVYATLRLIWIAIFRWIWVKRTITDLCYWLPYEKHAYSNI